HFMVGANQNNQLSINASPVLDNDEVYHEYLLFAGDPQKFIVTPDPPPPGAAHVCACWNEQYYWVPVDQAEAYQRLALGVTVTRGKGLTTVRDYFVATVKAFLPTDQFNEDLAKHAQAAESDGAYYGPFDYYVELDTAVPNDHEGRMSAVINGISVDLD